MRVPAWLRVMTFLAFMAGIAFFVTAVYFPPKLLEAAQEKSDAWDIGFLVTFFLWLAASATSKGLALFYGRWSKALVMASSISFIVFIVFTLEIPRATLSHRELQGYHNIVYALFLYGWIFVDLALLFLPALKNLRNFFSPATTVPPR